MCPTDACGWKRILAITGATGKSGGSFIKLLQKNKALISEQFDAFRLLTRQDLNLEAWGVNLARTDICRGDLRDYSFLEKAFEGVDTVVHIAGIHFSRNVVDAAVSCGVRRLILLHTAGIYSKYKKAGEEYRAIDTYCVEQSEKANILLTILRPTMIYGDLRDHNVVQFIQMVNRLPFMPVVNGARYALQPVHYEDLAKAYYDVLLNEKATAGREFILSGGEPILLREMLMEIAEKLRKRIHFVNCPFCIAYAGAWFVYFLTFSKVDYREKVQRLCEDRSFPHEDAASSFGYAPRCFREGIGAEVEAYVQQKSNNTLTIRGKK